MAYTLFINRKNFGIAWLVVALCMLLLAGCGTDAEALEKPGEKLKYQLIDNNTAYEVSDIGTYTDANVIIPATYNGLPVTSIGENAFFNCSNITSITIPNSVTNIGNNAFYGCSHIETATIPTIAIPYIPKIQLKTVVINGGESIGEYAFSNCSNLTSITISNSVTSIGEHAFSYCSDLTDITIPNSVMSIGKRAFSFCYKLANVTIGDNVTNIYSYAFYGCSNLMNVTFNDTTTWYWGTSGSPMDVTDASQNATYFKGIYNCYAWHKK